MSCDLIKIQEDIDYWEEIRKDAMDQLAFLTKESLFFKRSQNGEDSVEVQDIDNLEDWKIAELKYNLKQERLK